MLNKEQILSNKEKFINLLRTIKRPDCLIEELIRKLESSDFFTAPASTQYHCSYEGGLCYHSLNVYEQLKKLIQMEYGDNNISEDSIIIVSLLHDLSKMNFYETTMRNVKDEKGTWIQIPYIKVKEAKERFLYSTHGANSEYMVGRFIPLTLEESIAIINHMGYSEVNVQQSSLSEIYNRYSLAVLLHLADMLATFIDEAI